MMIRPVIAGNWSDWIRVFLVMRRPVDLAPGSHMSSVSTAVVSCYNSLPQAFTPEFGENVDAQKCSQETFNWVHGNG